MGLFGKLFEKKNCDICGKEIGLLGNRKLQDGNLCKECAGKLSPFFDDRRHATVAEIKEQLAYREKNKEAVAAFHVTRTLGSHAMVLLDEDAKKFIVTYDRGWQKENPDVIDFSAVTGCDVDVDESKNEVYNHDKDGHSISYDPPRYEFSYDFDVSIHVNGPYFSQIDLRINDGTIDSRTSMEYREAEQTANEIRSALTQIRTETLQQAVEAAAPKQPITCPSCGATALPDANGCCPYCGKPMK